MHFATMPATKPELQRVLANHLKAVRELFLGWFGVDLEYFQDAVFTRHNFVTKALHKTCKKCKTANLTKIMLCSVTLENRL